MSEFKREYNQILETLIGVFTVDKGKLKILLMRKKTEPYKGYWILPGNIVLNTETLENNVTDLVYEKLGLPSLYIEQCYTFSNLDRDPNDRVIATTFLGLIDNITLNLKQEKRDGIELAWFDLDMVPKLGYDHDIIIHRLIEHLRKRIINSNVFKILFPSDFTLPELQKIYEQILDKQFDRRNFRKKFMNLGLIEYTGELNVGFNGRPAKLYRFKENIIEKDLF